MQREDAPEVHRLGADGRVPELGEAGGLSAHGRRMAAGVVLAEVCAEGAEDAGAGAERHCELTVGSASGVDGDGDGEESVSVAVAISDGAGPIAGAQRPP